MLSLGRNNPGFDWSGTIVGEQWTCGEDSASLDGRSLAEGDSQHRWFRSGLSTPPGTKAMTGVSLNYDLTNRAANHNYTDNPHQMTTAFNDVPITRPANVHRQRSTSQLDSAVKPDQGVSRMHGRHSSDLQTHKNSEHVIASHLQIPGSVNKSKGSLAEFAAEVSTTPTGRMAGANITPDHLSILVREPCHISLH